MRAHKRVDHCLAPGAADVINTYTPEQPVDVALLRRDVSDKPPANTKR
jgi:hypothetical protein